MSLISVPNEVFEAPKGNRPFPEGEAQGTIDAVRTRSFPDFITGGKQGYSSSDGEILSIQLGDNQGLDGQDIGKQKLFVDFIIRDGDLSPSDADLNNSDTEAWQLAKSTRRLVRLASALGAIEVTDEGALFDPEEFVGGLQEGVYDGMEVRFKVFHRVYKKRDGSEGVEVCCEQFDRPL